MLSNRGHGAAPSLQKSSYTHYCILRIHPGQFNMLRRNLTPALEPRWNVTGFARMGHVEELAVYIIRGDI